MDEITISVKDVSVSHGKFKIKHISFELQNGEILGLIGRSGAGKSTIIKTLIGLKKPDSGKIRAYVNDKEINIKQLIGYSPQHNALFPFLTLEENLKVFGKLNNLSKKEIEKQIKVLLRRVDLQKSRKKRITELSGGMQKRADLAAALISSPKIIILDEPFSGLDISLQRFIWELLKELVSEGKIIIISSHMLHEIQQNCPKFGLVEKGAYFNTKQILRTLKSSKGLNLEQFLEKLFERSLVEIS